VTTPDKDHEEPWGIYSQGVSGKQEIGTIRLNMEQVNKGNRNWRQKNTSKKESNTR